MSATADLLLIVSQVSSVVMASKRTNGVPSRLYPPRRPDQKNAPKLSYPTKLMCNVRQVPLDTCKRFVTSLRCPHLYACKFFDFTTLQHEYVARYLDFQGLSLREDSTPLDYAVAMAKHVDSDFDPKFGVLHRFCASVRRRVFQRQGPRPAPTVRRRDLACTMW